MDSLLLRVFAVFIEAIQFIDLIGSRIIPAYQLKDLKIEQIKILLLIDLLDLKYIQSLFGLKSFLYPCIICVDKIYSTNLPK